MAGAKTSTLSTMPTREATPTKRDDSRAESWRRKDAHGLVKPSFRGYLHLIAAPTSLVMGLVLLVFVEERGRRAGVAVWIFTTVMLFGVSSAYHLGAGVPSVNQLLNHLDHANIYLFIAGTYTPFAAALSDPRSRTRLLSAVWAVAAAGLSVRVLWTRAPRWLSTSSYIGLGWIAVLFSNEMRADLGDAAMSLVAAGGVVYTLGGVAYARRHPDPTHGLAGPLCALVSRAT